MAYKYPGIKMPSFKNRILPPGARKRKFLYGGRKYWTKTIFEKYHRRINYVEPWKDPMVLHLEYEDQKRQREKREKEGKPEPKKRQNKRFFLNNVGQIPPVLLKHKVFIIQELAFTVKGIISNFLKGEIDY